VLLATVTDHDGSVAGGHLAETKLQNSANKLQLQQDENENVAELQASIPPKNRFVQKDSFHAPSTNTPPCIAKKSAALEVRDSIRFTQRSKSFKRSLPSQQRSALPLPIKRVVERSESNSSDDDGSSSPVSQDRSLLDEDDAKTARTKSGPQLK
jgi:hypothetical protein